MSTQSLNLAYQYSILIPCFCQASRMYEDNIQPPKVKCLNYDNTITGEIIERRYELDDDHREHIKTVIHCSKCKRYNEKY